VGEVALQPRTLAAPAAVGGGFQQTRADEGGALKVKTVTRHRDALIARNLIYISTT